MRNFTDDHRSFRPLSLGWALLHHKQEANCIYVNNVGPWYAIVHLGYHSTEGLA